VIDEARQLGSSKRRAEENHEDRDAQLARVSAHTPGFYRSAILGTVRSAVLRPGARIGLVDDSLQ
jgi:hypothetical protein